MNNDLRRLQVQKRIHYTYVEYLLQQENTLLMLANYQSCIVRFITRFQSTAGQPDITNFSM